MMLAWMLPLVTGLTYDVKGRVNFGGLFKDANLTYDLEVFVEEWPDLQLVRNAGEPLDRLMALTIGSDSVIRDQFGSPFKNSMGHDTFLYPMLFRTTANGSISEIFFHVNDGERSLNLKRSLVSSLQLLRKEPQDAVDRSIQYTSFEEHYDGPTQSDYVVRQGLIGRTVYTRRSNYQPTWQRPPEIVQTTDTVAIFAKSGTMLRLATSIQLATNFSGHANGDGDDMRQNISGLDQFPREPAVFAWTLRRPRSTHAERRLTTKRLARESDAFDRFSFQSSQLFVEARSVDHDAKCNSLIREGIPFLQCMLDDQAEEQKRVNCSSQLLPTMTRCPRFGLEITFAKVLGEQCLGPLDAKKRTCDLLVHSLAVLGSETAQDALIHFVAVSDVQNWRNEITYAIASIKDPLPKLLHAIADRLRSRVETHETEDSKLLLAAAALASTARTSREESAHAAARIDQFIVRLLHKAAKTDKDVWEPLHNRSWEAVDEMWNAMHSDLRSSWVGHHAHLSPKAHEWEARNSKTYETHVRHAKRVIQLELLGRMREYSDEKEMAHHSRVITLLRAARNAKSDIHAPLVYQWLDHRAEDVAAEAAAALEAHESELTERVILGHIRSHLERDSFDSDRRFRVTIELLKSLTSWNSTRPDAFSEAVRHLLRLPAYVSSSMSVCTSVRAKACNPHTLVECEKAWQNRCNEDSQMAKLLKELVNKRSTDEDFPDQVQKHIRRHLMDSHQSHSHLARSYRRLSKAGGVEIKLQEHHYQPYAA